MIKSATKKLSKKSKDINILNKAKNKNAIRVLYKKAGQAPEVKIISNVQRLKRAIIHKKLHIVPYENLFIICKHKKPKLNVQQNIFLPLNSIGGDLIVVKIDRKSREFKGLSQEDADEIIDKIQADENFSMEDGDNGNQEVEQGNDQSPQQMDNQMPIDNGNSNQFQQPNERKKKRGYQIDEIVNGVLNGVDNDKQPYQKTNNKKSFRKKPFSSPNFEN